MTLPSPFDLIVIGAGSGGIAASRRAASYGAKVLLIEGTRVGGTCVLRGCIPKKLMMYASEMRSVFSEASTFGWSEVATEFDAGNWTQAKDRELDRLEGVYCQMLANSGVQTLSGHARLVNERLVEVNGQHYRADRILIATGGAPSASGIAGLEQAWTSDDVLRLETLPKSLLVIGAGYIAVEFASIFAKLGVKVSMAYRADLPLRGFDEDLRLQSVHALKTNGVQLHPGVRIKTLVKNAFGFELELTDGPSLRADAVLNATGRRPNVHKLGLENVGIHTDAAGAIPVDENSRTTASGIWAIGDVTNRINLTPVAIAEGRAFADTEFGKNPMHISYANVASAVFCSPPIATIGLTELQAMRAGPTAVYVSQFRPMKKAFVGSQERTYMKLIVDSASDRVVGAHMLGTDAPEIIQGLAIAISAGATKRDFDRTMAMHPTSAEEFVLMREPARKHE
ncbi:glutathione-disulfide reductase [Comamonas thiooxydans]|uniref:glutathione-disulfide reductase n=1 Tax=Comamonas thiooxydans TaxID=363952 RepID=UPI000A2E1999|nr:glutathione-disulfide reductase [Comamonas thiooxydans]BDR10518.1 glutathione-disulfide reductase [Comamonas thiooxydans]